MAIIDMLFAYYFPGPPGFGIACALSACTKAIHDVNFEHAAARAMHHLRQEAGRRDSALWALNA